MTGRNNFKNRCKKYICACIIFLAALSGIIFSSASSAAKRPIDYRRTLFASVGQKTIMFEAPPGMCFLDQTSPYEESMYNAFKTMAERKGAQVLLAVFADCNSIANLGGSSGTNDIPLNSGVITWMNPSIGETTPLARQDYLDMREASFRQYAENGVPHPAKFQIDDKAHRTENGVFIGMSGEISMDDGKQNGSLMISTTSIRHIPVEVTLRYSGKGYPDLEKTYILMNKFMAQQISLNE